MAKEIDSGLYRIYSDNIPPFNGDKCMLPSFLGACDDLVANFEDKNHPNHQINRAIVRTIISKLRGHASELVSPREELNSWPLIKNFLNSAFADRRSEQTLLNDLMTASINKNETSAEFGTRLQLIRSLLVAKLNETGANAVMKQIKITNYEQLTLATYINNLHKDIKIIVKCKSPDSLEAAMQVVANEESEQEYDRRTQNRHKQNFQNLQSQNQKSIFKNQNYNQNFQDQPFQTKKYFTNQQVFSKQQKPFYSPFKNYNVFKPDRNFIPKNEQTPMSTQSRVPSLQTGSQYQNQPLSQSQVQKKFPWFKPTNLPKYVTEELHNVENEQIEPNFNLDDPEIQQTINEFPPYDFPEYYSEDFLEYLASDDQTSSQQNFQIDCATLPLT